MAVTNDGLGHIVNKMEVELDAAVALPRIFAMVRVGSSRARRRSFE